MKSDVSPPVAPPPPPPPIPRGLSNPRSSVGHRITVDDLHTSPLLNSLTSLNGESRSSLDRPLNSPISKYLSNRRESELSYGIKEKDQQTAPRIREISSNVGFVSLPDQVRRRSIKKGFEFNLMVVGKISLSKKMFIDLYIEKVNLDWVNQHLSIHYFKLNYTVKIFHQQFIERRKVFQLILHQSF